MGGNPDKRFDAGVYNSVYYAPCERAGFHVEGAHFVARANVFDHRKVVNVFPILPLAFFEISVLASLAAPAAPQPRIRRHALRRGADDECGRAARKTVGIHREEAPRCRGTKTEVAGRAIKEELMGNPRIPKAHGGRCREAVGEQEKRGGRVRCGAEGRGGGKPRADTIACSSNGTTDDVAVGISRECVGGSAGTEAAEGGGAGVGDAKERRRRACGRRGDEEEIGSRSGRAIRGRYRELCER